MLRFFLLLSLIGCGTSEDIWKKKDTDINAVNPNEPVEGCPLSALARIHEGRFTSYLNRFSKDAKRFDVGCYRTASMYFDIIRVESEEPDAKVVGLCSPGIYIIIDTPSWANMGYTDRRTLIYHELGHCALGLGHTKKDELDIMSPVMLDENTAELNWKELVEKMFTRAKEMQDDY